MSTDLAVAVSAQVALQRQLDLIANNIANVNTTGFRAAGMRFEAEMSTVGDDPVAFSSPGETYIHRRAGPMSFTGNSLDVAVDGDGWLALEAPVGTVYTRDGRFHLTDLGELRSVNDYPVLDAGGAPITIDPSAGPIVIGENGAITQNGTEVGVIGLFLIPDGSAFVRYDNSAIIVDQADPVEDPTVNSIRQGYVEGSNVNAVIELTRLIEVQRAFEQAAAAIAESDSLTEEAIRTLAPG